MGALYLAYPTFHELALHQSCSDIFVITFAVTLIALSSQFLGAVRFESVNVSIRKVPPDSVLTVAANSELIFKYSILIQ
jgi:hypothetical protein